MNDNSIVSTEVRNKYEWDNMEIGEPIDVKANQNPAPAGNKWAKSKGNGKRFAGRLKSDGIYTVFRIA